MPGCRQVVFIDEPKLDELMGAEFPIAPDTAVDLVSAALAAIEPVAVTGLHVCATADIASLVAIGPDVLSVPVDMRLLESAGYLATVPERRRHDRLGRSVDRGPDRDVGRAAVAQAQRAVVRARATRRRPGQLRQQSIITPECGLGTHTPAVAERVHRLAGRHQRACQGSGHWQRASHSARSCLHSHA